MHAYRHRPALHVTPRLLDQRWWAARVKDLGCGSRPVKADSEDGVAVELMVVLTVLHNPYVILVLMRAGMEGRPLLESVQGLIISGFGGLQ